MVFLWYFFDIIGTIAFAISGTLVGISRKMDIFGIFSLAAATAIGGGIIRDVMLGNVPPNSLRSPLYVLITIAIVVIMFIIYRKSSWRYTSTRRFRKLYLVADALGLASFTVTGASMALHMFPDYWIVSVTLGLITAVGGGIIRDILAQRIPSVLREEVYALPAIVGGVIYNVMASENFAYWGATVSFTVVFVFRMLAIRYQWSLPKVHR